MTDQAPLPDFALSATGNPRSCLPAFRGRFRVTHSSDKTGFAFELLSDAGQSAFVNQPGSDPLLHCPAH